MSSISSWDPTTLEYDKPPETKNGNTNDLGNNVAVRSQPGKKLTQTRWNEGRIVTSGLENTR